MIINGMRSKSCREIEQGGLPPRTQVTTSVILTNAIDVNAIDLNRETNVFDGQRR